jgi:hypothetical protein
LDNEVISTYIHDIKNDLTIAIGRISFIKKIMEDNNETVDLNKIKLYSDKIYTALENANTKLSQMSIENKKFKEGLNNG